MPTTLAARIGGLLLDQRKSALKLLHPLYTERADQWQVLLDAYEGSGGFLNGGYLWQYRREEAGDFLARQTHARYHNFAKTIVGMYARYVFGGSVTRETTSDAVTDWWKDVDGAGTTIQAFMARALKLALAQGHEGILIDKSPETPTGPRRSDESSPFLTLYPPTSILDWRLVKNRLVGLKLAEDAPSGDILAERQEDEELQYLLWTPDEWARFDLDAELLSDDTHGLEDIPFVMLRPDPSAAHPWLGQSLLGDGHVFQALYNRCAEEDEVLRSQGFSLFVIQANNADDIERIKQQFGGVAGTTRAVVTSGVASYETPDQQVPEAIRKNISWLIQEIYRAAHVRFNRDSLDAESAEAIRLQHSELNEMLTGTAQACSQVEHDLVRWYFRWTTPTPEAADAAFEAADVNIGYPDEFFTRELVAELEEVAMAISQDCGPTFNAHIRKHRVVRRMEPDLDEATLATIDKEIDAQAKEEPTPAEELKAKSQARFGAIPGAA